MKEPNEINRKSVRKKSSSSTITIPERKSDKENNSFRGGDDAASPTDYLLALWSAMVAFWKTVTGYLYESAVNFVAGFIADVMSHPTLRTIVVDVIVAAINAFMDQDDIGTKFDDTARRVMYDTEKARDASHALGKEVVPVVTGFIGGVASSLKPSEFIKRSKRRKERESTRDIEFVSELSNNSFEEEDQQDDDHRRYQSESSKKTK